jgi:hypothetical protein
MRVNTFFFIWLEELKKCPFLTCPQGAKLHPPHLRDGVCDELCS